MRTVIELFAAAVMLAGVALGIYAYALPSRFDIANASAIQVTQVYSQATLYAVLAVALFVLAGVLTLAVRPSAQG
jgi:uncharacterized membrane protein YidH (DUF202 family)